MLTTRVDDAVLFQSFDVRISPERDGLRVTAVGALTFAVAEKLETAVVELLDNGIEHLILDLQRLSFTDTQGLRALLSCDARASKHDARLELVCRPGQVSLLLHRTGLDALLDDHSGP